MSRKTGKRKLEAIQSNTTDDILREVLNAFDGSRSDIGNTMKEFLEKNLPLKPQDLNRLLNAFIIDRNNPLAVEMGLSSNVPEPRAKKNQPVVDNLNWSQQFLSQYKGMFNDPVVDKILVVLFVQSYKLTAELSNYLSQNETENLKALRLILDSLTQDNSSKESVDAIFRMIMNRERKSNSSKTKDNLKKEKYDSVLVEQVKNAKLLLLLVLVFQLLWSSHNIRKL